MWRSDLGWINFVWGDAKKGVAHIISKRMSADGMTREQVLRLLTEDLVKVIAWGETVRRDDLGNASRLVVERGGVQAILSRNNSTNGWLLSGFEMRGASGEAGRGATLSDATQATSIRSRSGMGADAHQSVPLNNGSQAYTTPDERIVLIADNIDVGNENAVLLHEAF